MGTVGGHFLYGAHPGHCFLFLYGSNSRLFAGGYRCRRCLAINRGSGRIRIGTCIALCSVRHVSGWLQSLPKSGGWLTTVKVVLGFLELAMAIKFLSNADLVEQWGVIKREIFIGAWVIIGVLIVLYLLGRSDFRMIAR